MYDGPQLASQEELDREKWEKARRAMLLDPEMINLNTGSFGPLPRCVFETAQQHRRRLAEEPMAFLVREAPPLLWRAREALASFLGADPYRLVFTANVSSAINTIAAALRLAAPGEILLTDHEYGAMHWCWERAAQRQGLTLRTFPLPIMATSATEIVDAFVAALTPQTRLLFFSHVLSPTGLVLPAKEICAETNKRNILTVIDGAHAPAMIPLNINDVQCDFYTGNCHKWLLAPTGAGFLHVRPGNEDRLTPMQVSWGWRASRDRWHVRNDFGATDWIYQYEFEGTRDPCAWLAVPAAIDFQSAIGLAEIRQRNERLVKYTIELLAGKLGLTLWTPQQPELHGFMTAFRLPCRVHADRMRTVLWQKHRIELPIIEKEYGQMVRVSTHFYNTFDELDHLADVLPQAIEVARV